MKKLFTVVAILALAASAQAAPITIGTSTSPNCFPFGCASGTRYQQVYDASSFAGLFTIGGVTFFNSDDAGQFTSADYTLSLSTTSKSVNGLDTVNFDSNVGLDDTLLFSGHLSGATGTSYTFGGLGVFTYNPALGNLLVDIHLSNVGGGGGAYFDATSDSGGLFSRAHNFGSGFDNYGLVTRFEEGSNNSVPEPGSSLLLLGIGLVGLRAWRKRR